MMLSTQRGGCAPLDVEDLVSHATEVLRSGEDPQIPDIVYKSGDLRVPFAPDRPWQSTAPALVPGAMIAACKCTRCHGRILLMAGWRSEESRWQRGC